MFNELWSVLDAGEGTITTAQLLWLLQQLPRPVGLQDCATGECATLEESKAHVRKMLLPRDKRSNLPYHTTLIEVIRLALEVPLPRGVPVVNAHILQTRIFFRKHQCMENLFRAFLDIFDVSHIRAAAKAEGGRYHPNLSHSKPITSCLRVLEPPSEVSGSGPSTFDMSRRSSGNRIRPSGFLTNLWGSFGSKIMPSHAVVDNCARGGHGEVHATVAAPDWALSETGLSELGTAMTRQRMGSRHSVRCMWPPCYSAPSCVAAFLSVQIRIHAVLP